MAREPLPAPANEAVVLPTPRPFHESKAGPYTQPHLFDEFALTIDGKFEKFKRMPYRPPNLPHKKMEWWPVVREYGKPFEGVFEGNYVIRVRDPVSQLDIVPESAPRRLFKLALLELDVLERVEQFMRDQPDPKIRIWWEDSEPFWRNDPVLALVGPIVGLDTDEKLDRLFRLTILKPDTK